MELKTNGVSTLPVNGEVVFSRLRDSTAYRTYRRAFTDITKLPLSLEPVLGSKEQGERAEEANVFCLLVGDKAGLSCARCRCGRLRRHLSSEGTGTVCSLPCGAGLRHGLAPVRFGQAPVAFLVVGQYLTHLPSDGEVARLQPRWEKAGGADTTQQTYRSTFAGTRVLSPEDHRQAMSMLAACAERLSGLINHVLLELDEGAPEALHTAVSMIHSNGDREVGLDEIARTCGVTTEALGKSFKHAMGFDFYDYKIRRRLERGRKALMALQPASIAEAADLAGCSTVAEFRNLFEDYLGESPESYHARMQENGRLMKVEHGTAVGYPLSLSPKR